MASVNDNLFTILSERANSPEESFSIQACGGIVTIEFSEAKLAALDYRHASGGEVDAEDKQLKTAFLEWLAAFQRLPIHAQWQQLAPGGTVFQRQVWQQLLNVPLGSTCSYGELAAAIGKPKAARAVGSAVGANPICLLIPCHRVINASGTSGNYRWGADKKLALLDAEQTAGCDLLSLFQ